MTLSLLLLHNQGGNEPIDEEPPYIEKVQNTEPDNLILYHPMNELSGEIVYDFSPKGNNGIYSGTSLGHPGIGDGLTCPRFEKNDLNDFYSLGFNGDFDGTKFSISIWAKVFDSGIWSDNFTGIMVQLLSTSADVLWLRKLPATGQLEWYLNAGGSERLRTKTGLATTTSWMQVGITVDDSNDTMKCYFNGIQEGGDVLGIGTWSGNLLNGAITVGESPPGGIGWRGYLAHFAVWDIILSARHMKNLSIKQ
jgi:hypothetical protein